MDGINTMKTFNINKDYQEKYQNANAKLGHHTCNINGQNFIALAFTFYHPILMPREGGGILLVAHLRSFG